MLTRMKYPCKDCEDREIGCHSSCDKYKSVRTEHKERHDNIYKMKSQDNDYYDIVVAPKVKNRFSSQRAKKYNYGK